MQRTGHEVGQWKSLLETGVIKIGHSHAKGNSDHNPHYREVNLELVIGLKINQNS